MSLLLRKACQPTLDDASLGSFHVRVDENTKTMTIVGECGQPFVSISGIKFARTSPSAAEMPLAVDLLEIFLVKHKGDFDRYVIELAKYNKIKKVKMKTDKYDIDTHGYGEKMAYTIKFDSGAFQVWINEDGTIYHIFLNGSSNTCTMEELAKGPDYIHLLNAHKYLVDYMAYIGAKAEMNRLKGILSSCEI